MNPISNIPIQYQTPKLLNYVNSQGVKPPAPINPTFTVDSLKTETPLTVRPRPVDTTADSIIATTNQGVVDYQQAAQKAELAQKAAGTGAEAARNRVTKLAEDLYNQKSTVQGNQVALENAAGLPEQQKILSDLNNEIANEQVALRAAQDRIRATGMSKDQANIEVSNLNNTYGRRLADLAIRQSAAQGNISAIQSNADRQTKLLLAPLDNKLAFLTSFEKDNINALDAKEKEKLALIIDDTKTQAQTIKDLQKAKTDMITEIAKNGGGNNQTLLSQIQEAKNIDEIASIGAASGFVGLLERRKTEAETQKLLFESRPTGNADFVSVPGVGLVNANAAALAQDFAVSGKLPTPADLKAAGTTFAEVAKIAKEAPKFAGALVDKTTGVKSGNVSPTIQADFSALYNITRLTNELIELDKKRYKGVVPGLLGAAAGSAIQAEYLTKRKAIIDEISRMQSGAALTPDEVAFYKEYLPGRFTEAFFLGQDSEKKIKNFQDVMNSKLTNGLDNYGLSIYGFSKVNIGDKEFKVGDVIDNGSGQKGRINPDGTITIQQDTTQQNNSKQTSIGNGKEIVAGYDITTYATDPQHGIKVQNIYKTLPEISSAADIDAIIQKKAPGSPLRGQDVLAAATKYNVDPKMMLAIMQQDSTLGTRGLAVRTYNPGNVGNTDDGSTRNYGSWPKGIEAVAKNLYNRKIS